MKKYQRAEVVSKLKVKARGRGGKRLGDCGSMKANGRQAHSVVAHGAEK